MIGIGRNIYNALKDVELSSLLGGEDKICPIFLPEDVLYPFLVYRTTGMGVEGNKDYDTDIIYVRIIVASDDYDASVLIARKVRELLESYSDEVIEESKLTSISEDFEKEAFIQLIDFEVKTFK